MRYAIRNVGILAEIKRYWDSVKNSCLSTKLQILQVDLEGDRF